jgi:beta-glucanase (GH16 family)
MEFIKKYSALFIFLQLLMFFKANAQKTFTKFVWKDEFNTPVLPGSSKWNYDIGTGCGGWGNNELEYYPNRLSDAEVVNGVLKITAKKENFSGSFYTPATTKFHIYKLEWSASSIAIYADDKLYRTVANSSSIPFNQNFFLIVNVAMEGKFDGSADPAFSNVSMEIDYIMV